MLLEKLTKTQLTDPDIIPSRKINFFGDMDGKLLGGNTAGRFDSILLYFTPAGMNFKNKYEAMISSKVVKEGSRMVTDEEMATISQDLHLLAKEVDFRSGLKSSVGHVIFPGGLGLINGITKENISTTLTTIANGFALNNIVYPGKSAQVMNMKITYTLDRNTYNTDLGFIDTNKADLESLETIFNEAFSDAVCDLSKYFRYEPGVAASFWNQSLLLPIEHHKHNHLSGTLAEGEFIIIKTRDFFEKTQIMLNSITEFSTIEATILFKQTDPILDHMEVTGNASSTKKAWDIGGKTGTLLMLKNLSPGSADWAVDIID